MSCFRSSTFSAGGKVFRPIAISSQLSSSHKFCSMLIDVALSAHGSLPARIMTRGKSLLFIGSPIFVQMMDKLRNISAMRTFPGSLGKNLLHGRSVMMQLSPKFHSLFELRIRLGFTIPFSRSSLEFLCVTLVILFEILTHVLAFVEGHVLLLCRQGLMIRREKRVSSEKVKIKSSPYGDIGNKRYKGSSAIANTLLTAINERIFHNDGKPEMIPLQTLIAASNELPAESEELAAFHDRFLLKYEVKYIFERGSFLRMLSGYSIQGETTSLSMDELAACQEEVRAVTVTDEVRTLVDKIRFELQKEGIIVSDRVFNTSQDLVKAETWLMGLKETPPEALAICQHAYWDEPKKSRNVKMTVLRASSKEMLAIEQAYEEAQDLIRVKTKMDDETSELKEGLETRKKLQKIVKVLAEGIEFFEKKKLPSFKYKSMLEAARFRLQTIDADLMGEDMETITKKKGK